jgi:hypothetical protein
VLDPAPVTVSMGGPSGLIFFPDVQHKPHGYTALFMQVAEGTVSEEVKGLSILFQQKEEKVDGHAFILLAVGMKSVLVAVQTMHATGMTQSYQARQHYGDNQFGSRWFCS